MKTSFALLVGVVLAAPPGYIIRGHAARRYPKEYSEAPVSEGLRIPPMKRKRGRKAPLPLAPPPASVGSASYGDEMSEVEEAPPPVAEDDPQYMKWLMTGAAGAMGLGYAMWPTTSTAEPVFQRTEGAEKKVEPKVVDEDEGYKKQKVIKPVFQEYYPRLPQKKPTKQLGGVNRWLQPQMTGYPMTNQQDRGVDVDDLFGQDEGELKLEDIELPDGLFDYGEDIRALLDSQSCTDEEALRALTWYIQSISATVRKHSAPSRIPPHGARYGA